MDDFYAPYEDIVGDGGDFYEPYEDIVGDLLKETTTVDVEAMDQSDNDFGSWPEVEDKLDMIRGPLYARESPDELHGIDVLGLVPQLGAKNANKLQTQKGQVGFSVHTMKNGVSFLKTGTRASSVTVPQTAIDKARTVALSAGQLAARLKNFKSVAHKTRVHGYVVVGVAGGGAIRPGSAVRSKNEVFRVHVKLPSDAQVRSLAAALGKAATKLNGGADAHVQRIAAIRDAGKQGKKGNHILGAQYYVGSAEIEQIVEESQNEEDEVMGYGWADIVGQGPDPSNPGYLTDGSIDPNYQSPTSTGPGQGGSSGGGGGGSGGSDWQTVLDADAAAVAALPGPDTNYGLPARPSNYADAVAFEKGLDPTAQSLEEAFALYNDPALNARTADGSDGGPPADQNFYFTNPDDASRMSQSPVQLDPIASGIVYKIGRIPFLNVGSYTVWFGTYQGLTPNGGEGSGLELHEDGWYRWRAQYEDDTHRTYDKRLYKQDDETSQQLLVDSVKQNFGPLMGRPDMQILWAPGEGRNQAKDSSVPEAVNLRFDCSTGGFFWFWNAAPENYKLQRRLAYVAQAQLDWDAAATAAKQNYLQAVATLKQDQADADAFNKDQAKINAALQAQIDQDTKKQQAAEAAAQSQANVLATQTQAQQQQSQAQQDQAQSAFGLAQQQAQLDYDKQASQVNLQAFQQAVQRQPPGGALDDGTPDQADDGGVDAMEDPSQGQSDGSDLEADPSGLDDSQVSWDGAE